ncbi:MAG: anthranilate phosphoribosyltransferase [Syntrophomonadaceae bacterium]|nr:anthranilate phosphoribosyltransferase [Syntrophomonadaceae bacterium]
MIKEMIKKVVRRENLSTGEAKEVMEEIMEGKATPAQIGSLITALSMKGETVAEIAGFAQAMRAKALPIKSRHPTFIDTCGTGGDGSGTFNISTTVALVVAAAGLPVAKHGNRSVSSKSGSADLLEALGVRIDLCPRETESILNELGIAFLYAPFFHQAMRHAVGPRQEVGIRSVFNILGPLTNPAQAPVQVLGVYDPNLTEVMAQVLERLDTKTAYVVHGAGGLDEVSTLGPTKISCLCQGSIKNLTIYPEDYGLDRANLAELQGGEASQNALITMNILEGQPGPCQDIVLLNSAVALVAGGIAEDIREGIKIGRETLTSGQALDKLQQFRRVTNRRGQKGEEA